MRQAGKKHVWAAAAALLLASASSYGADGNQLVGFGATQKSLGGAGAASPQDATWIVINPATLADLDRRIDATFEVLNIHVDAEPRGIFLLSDPLAGQMKFQTLVAIPSFAVVWFLDEKKTLGFGLIGMAGNRTDFHHPRSTIALFNNGDRRAAEQIARIPLSISHKFDTGWSVGIAVVPALIRFRTDSLTLKLHTTNGDNRYDNAYGAGFSVGVYKSWDKWSLGAAFSSRVFMTNFPRYKHDLTFWSLDLPQQVQVGVAYRPVQPVQLVLDYKWIDWDAINLFGRETVHGGLGWQSQNIVKGGVIWDIAEKWTARAGFSITNPVVDSKHVFANILTPSVAEAHVGTGFSYRRNDHSSVHLSYEMSIPATRTESGNGDIFSILGKGSKVTYEEYSVTAQYTYEF